MERTSQDISLRFPDGSVSPARLERQPQDSSHSLWLYLGSEVLSAHGTDYFNSLADIRRQLEPRGIFPICYGASLSCYPSGMSRDMGSGLTVYRLGSGGTQLGTAKTFETGDDVVPATVADQRNYFDEWLKHKTRNA